MTLHFDPNLKLRAVVGGRYFHGVAALMKDWDRSLWVRAVEAPIPRETASYPEGNITPNEAFDETFFPDDSAVGFPGCVRDLCSLFDRRDCAADRSHSQCRQRPDCGNNGDLTACRHHEQERDEGAAQAAEEQ
jgi:hypothetical protein